MSTKQGNYDVGYGKPPVPTRFQKGKSGNPKGFPKGQQKLKFVLLRFLAMTCEEMACYEPQTAMEAMAKRLIIIAATDHGGAGLRAVKIICDRTEGRARRRSQQETVIHVRFEDKSGSFSA